MLHFAVLSFLFLLLPFVCVVVQPFDDSFAADVAVVDVDAFVVDSFQNSPAPHHPAASADFAVAVAAAAVAAVASCTAFFSASPPAARLSCWPVFHCHPHSVVCVLKWRHGLVCTPHIYLPCNDCNGTAHNDSTPVKE